MLVPDDAPPLAELELHWHGAGGSRVEEVRIKTSETLADWRAAGGGAIARLRGNGEAFLQRRVPLRVHNARFYRIEWDSITITSEALLRPEQIKLAFAEDNGVLAARIEIRNTAASSWHRVYQGVFYRLQDSGGVLRNPPRPLTGEAMRELRLEVTTGQAGSARTAGLGWIPPRVIFVASGPKPYLRAAGATEPGTAAVTPAAEVGGRNLDARAGPAGCAACFGRQRPRCNPGWRLTGKPFCSGVCCWQAQ